MITAKTTAITKRILLFSLVLVLLAAVFAACRAGGDGGETTAAPDTEETGKAADTEPSEETTERKKDEPSVYHYKNAYISENGMNLSFGVLNEINLFEPGKRVDYYITYSGKKITGKECTVTISCDEEEYNNTETFLLEGGEINKGFTPVVNGIYRFTLDIPDAALNLSFRIGVVPRAKTANAVFSYSVQPYVARLYMGRNVQVMGQSSMDRSENTILETISYMGMNCIREDSVYWSDIQPHKGDPYNFAFLDKLVKAANDRGMTLLYTLGTPPTWARKEAYRNETDICYNVCPEAEYWEDFCRALAEHYKDLPAGSIIWEVWNEPDGEFFFGTPEEFDELYRICVNTMREVDPDAFIIGPGMCTPINDAWGDSSFKWYKPGMGSQVLATSKELIGAGKLNTYSLHLHYHFDDNFFAFMDNGIGLAEKNAGITNNGAFNTESGVCTDDDEVQASDNVAKALWFRTHGYGGFTVFSFSNYAEGTDPWSMFNGFLQPRLGVIAYTNMLNMVGQATEVENIADDRSIFADIFYDGTNSVVTVYCQGEQGSGVLTLPEGKSYRKYDMLGNSRSATQNKVQASAKVIYLVYEGKVSASEFSYTLG